MVRRGMLLGKQQIYNLPEFHTRKAFEKVERFRKKLEIVRNALSLSIWENPMDACNLRIVNMTFRQIN